MTITENELLEELYAAYYRPPFDPKIHVTVASLAERLESHVDFARGILEDLVKKGELKWVEVRKPDGKPVRAVVKVG